MHYKIYSLINEHWNLYILILVIIPQLFTIVESTVKEIHT